MSRGLSNDFITAATAAETRPVFMLEVIFSALTLNLCTAPTNIVWNSKTWLGNGWMHPHVGPRESKDPDATVMDITLTGMPQDLIAAILGNNFQGTKGSLYFGFLAADFSVIDAILAFPGRLDVPILDENPDGSMVTLRFESPVLSLEQPREYYYNPESQKIFYPTDKGFDYVDSVDKWDGFWGKQKKKLHKNQTAKTQRHTKKGSRKKRGN